MPLRLQTPTRLVKFSLISLLVAIPAIASAKSRQLRRTIIPTFFATEDECKTHVGTVAQKIKDVLEQDLLAYCHTFETEEPKETTILIVLAYQETPKSQLLRFDEGYVQGRLIVRQTPATKIRTVYSFKDDAIVRSQVAETIVVSNAMRVDFASLDECQSDNTFALQNNWRLLLRTCREVDGRFVALINRFCMTNVGLRTCAIETIPSMSSPAP